MTLYTVLGVAVCLLLLALLWWRRAGRDTGMAGELRIKPLLSTDAQQLFERMQAALPGHRLMPAVSLGAFAFCTCADRVERARRAALLREQSLDFLICDAQWQPIAAVELDDVVRGSQDRGAARATLRELGLPLLRWTTVDLPSVAEIRAALEELEALSRVELEPALLGAGPRREPYL